MYLGWAATTHIFQRSTCPSMYLKLIFFSKSLKVTTMMMSGGGWYPRELLQTSDLNQPPLETFLRTGTKLSPQSLPAIKIDNILFWMYFPVYNWDFASAAFWSSIVQCHNCDWCFQLWVIRHRLKRTSEGWSQIDQRLQNAVNLQRFSAGSFTRFSLIRLRSVVNFSMLKFYNNGHLQNFPIFLVFRDTIWWSFWYVPHLWKDWYSAFVPIVSLKSPYLAEWTYFR